ncbi:MAG: hypothetical protein H6835_11385 [Planctomycetes bacterium]|nr:hypothetical protein [Planctomycetota bacterium]
MKSSAAPILVAAAAVAAMALLRGGRDAGEALAPVADASTESSAGEGAAQEPVRPPASAGGAVVQRAPSDAAPRGRAEQMQLPDGTFVPALNGAVDAAPLKDFWGPFPWSPIVGVERSAAGLDWYRHADGSYSTTQMVWRPDLGREAAMTRVAHPGPVDVPAAGGAGAGR